MNYSRTSSNGKSLYKPYTVYTFAPVSYSDGDTTYDGRLMSNTLTGSQQLLNGNSYYDGADFGYSYQINPQLNYHIKLNEHDISAMYVYEVAESGSNALSLTAKQMLVDNVENIQGFSKDAITGSSGKGNISRRMSHILGQIAICLKVLSVTKLPIILHPIIVGGCFIHCLVAGGFQKRNGSEIMYAELII